MEERELIEAVKDLADRCYREGYRAEAAVLFGLAVHIIGGSTDALANVVKESSRRNIVPLP
jgi:hypothetical protein